ncbi:MAG: protein-L-isoaspartate O-methyltransferase [Oxalobacteraceae bacterium]|nr:protein-L-isoaspartate O-methyltransferase [Oxalobacteraceae bacterium]
MKLEQARHNMIEQQIRTWDVLDQSVLRTLVDVRREAFVPVAYQSLAFVDTEIPLPCGQHMLSPKLEARLLQEAALQDDELVVEIGAGSGYMAALLARHARHVVSVEIEPALKTLAEQNLRAYGIENVTVELGDGARGWPGHGAEAPVMSACLITRTAEDAWDTRKLFETNISPLRNAERPSAFKF